MRALSSCSSWPSLAGLLGPALLAPLALGALLCSTKAEAAPAEALLAAMADAEGADYRAARDAALAQLPADEVAARLRAAEASDKTWREVAMLAVLDAHHRPGSFTPLFDLSGLDPAVYLKARRPDPAVARELSRKEVHPGALIEVLLKDQRAYPFADDAAYPAHLLPRLATVRAQEEEALQVGLVTGLAKARGDQPGAAAAGYVIEHVAKAAHFGPVRRQAAVMLPLASAELASRTLPGLMTGADDVALRAAAAVGLGKVRTSTSIDALTGAVRADEPAVRVAAIRALGALGGRWVRQRAEGEAGLSRKASAVVVEALARAADRGADKEIRAAVDALGMIADPGSRAGLQQLAQSGSEAQQAAATRALRRLDRVLARGR